MELKKWLLVLAIFPVSGFAQFLPTTWTEQERDAQMKADNERALEERKLMERKAMEIKAAHLKKRQLEAQVVK